MTRAQVHSEVGLRVCAELSRATRSAREGCALRLHPIALQNTGAASYGVLRELEDETRGAIGHQ